MVVELHVHCVVFRDAVAEGTRHLDRLRSVGMEGATKVPAEPLLQIVAKLLEVLLKPYQVHGRDLLLGSIQMRSREVDWGQSSVGHLTRCQGEHLDHVIVDERPVPEIVLVDLFEGFVIVRRREHAVMTEIRKRPLHGFPQESEGRESLSEHLCCAQREVPRHDPDLVAALSPTLHQNINGELRNDGDEVAVAGTRVHGALAEVTFESLEQCRTRGLLDMNEEEARSLDDRLGHMFVPTDPAARTYATAGSARVTSR
jgi:hypothetical protein